MKIPKQPRICPLRLLLLMSGLCWVASVPAVTVPADLEQIGSEVDPATNLPLVVRTRQTGHELRLVPGGTCVIGSEEGDADEMPVHTVTKYPFYLATCTVSNLQYERYKPEHISERGEYAREDHQPATHVNWYDAVGYIQYVAEQEGEAVGRDLTAMYAMPTEAAAEKAAQGSTSPRRYPWGDTLSESDKKRYSPVTAKGVDEGTPNDLGFYHMTGNVFYWCYDWYDSEYYKKAASNNPLGATTGKTKSLRGGIWYIYNKSLRCADRWNNFPGVQSDFIGIRFGRYTDDMLP